MYLPNSDVNLGELPYKKYVVLTDTNFQKNPDKVLENHFVGEAWHIILSPKAGHNNTLNGKFSQFLSPFQ